MAANRGIRRNHTEKCRQLMEGLMTHKGEARIHRYVKRIADETARRVNMRLLEGKPETAGEEHDETMDADIDTGARGSDEPMPQTTPDTTAPSSAATDEPTPTRTVTIVQTVTAPPSASTTTPPSC